MALLALAVALLAACGGQAPTPDADLMANTTVGRNRCQPGKATERPFVVEWDATDFASFESKAARDTVFVKVDGCELTVLDCRGDIPGKYGTYDTPQWTTGVVEGFEIKNEGDLYAKLPFGANSFAATVKGGNELQLKYFVSGSRPSLRSMIYKNDIASNPLCAGATHFVSGYDLGAFDLAQRGQSAEGANAKAGNAAAGGNLSHSEAHLKTAGSLADCTKDSAKDMSRCRVPIRLALRAVADGTNPAPQASAPQTDGSWKDFRAASDSAGRKMELRDGAACLADLDRAAAIRSEEAKGLELARSSCEMLVGRCEDGRRRYRGYLAEHTPQMTPDQLDGAVLEQGVRYCEGKEATPLERAIRDNRRLSEAMQPPADGAKCTTLGADLSDAWPNIPATANRYLRAQTAMALKYGADCIAKGNGDCATGKKLWTQYVAELYATSSDATRQSMLASYQCPAASGASGITTAAAPTPTLTSPPPPKKKKKKPAAPATN